MISNSRVALSSSPRNNGRPLSQLPERSLLWKGDAFRLTGQLIIVRIEIHPAVLEVIDGKGLTLLVRHLTADTAYRTHRWDRYR